MASEQPLPTGYYDEPVLKPPRWGWNVVAYLWLGGAGAGAYVIGSLATLRGGTDDAKIARHAYCASAAAMALCPPLLISHLGRPDRFHHMLRVWKPSSPMNAGVWAMSALAGLAFASAAAALSRRVGRALWRKDLAILGTPVALFVGTYTGVLLTHSSIPLWAASSALPAVFACSALGSGAALVSLASALSPATSAAARRRLDRTERLAAIAEGLALMCWLRDVGKFAKPLASVRLRGLFQFGAAFCGLVLPTVLPAPNQKGVRGWLDIAKPLLVLGGALALRYCVVEGGKMSARDQQAYLEFTSGYLLK